MIVLFVTAVALGACGNKKHSFKVENGVVKMDDRPYFVASAEIDYARLPREYWESKLEVLSTMGVNTVTVKVPWMLHEPREGVFDFSGMNDVKSFCRIAQNKGLLVWLHIGPYVGAEWDMGGLPWWLLKYDGIVLRSVQKQFMQHVERYFAALGKELSGSLINNGGNIAMLQIEEAQGLTGDDKGYLRALLDCAKKSGFENVVTFTAATKDSYIKTSINEAYFSLDIDTKASAENNFVGVTKFRYDVPQVCSSIIGDYKAVWGGEPAERTWNKSFMRTYELLKRGTHFSINGVVAGNSYGATSGASMADGVYKPYTTAHNVDGLLKLWGGVDNNNYKRFMQILYAYLREDMEISNVAIPFKFLATFPEVQVTDVAPLFDNLPIPIESKSVMTMEKCDVASGAMLYSTLLPATVEGAKVMLKGVHDHAQLFVDGALLATVDRRNGEDAEVALPALPAGAKLDILVDATGRVGDVMGYNDCKGLTKDVEISNGDDQLKKLSDWKIYPLPTDYAFASSKEYKNISDSHAPGFYRVTFNKVRDGDTYLYMGDWGKGEVWLNGKPLGRFWNCGPQTALYIPDCWLKDSANELVIVVWIGPSKAAVLGIDYTQM